MFGPFPIATPTYGDAINQPGSHTKRTHRVLSIPCETRTCRIVFPPDVEVYSIQDRLIFNNGPLSFIVDCPAGHTCPPGTFPKVVTYPRGTFIIPDPNNPGFPIFISMVGCQSIVTRILPAGSSAALVNSTAQEVIALIAQQQAECDSVEPPNNPPPPTPFFTNAEAFSPFDCAECEALVYDGDPPWYITIDTANNRIVLAAGMIAADTQANADAQAQAFLDAFVEAAEDADKLSCTSCTITTGSPLPDASIGIPYSETLTVIDTVETNVWTVDSGSLPDGLSLNSSTGEISGTPTAEETANFTIKVTSGAQCCTKAFVLDVAAAGDCPDWATELMWGTATTLNQDGGVGIFIPNNVADDDFTTSCTVTGVFDSQAAASNLGTLVYNGTGCNCNLHIGLINTILGGSGNNTAVDIISTLAGSLVSTTLDNTASGDYDFPFTIPDTLGVPDTIFVNITSQKSYQAGASTIQMGGTITNV